jgi:hypothetical protein
LIVRSRALLLARSASEKISVIRSSSRSRESSDAAASGLPTGD